MKSIVKLLVLNVVLTCYSCSDWLNVNPQTEIKATELFKEEYGFKTALTGVYIMMAEEALYGKNMSSYLPELLARNWYFGSSSLDQLYRISNYDLVTQEEEKSLFSELWIHYYKAIAQLNNILEELENTKVNFEAGNDKLVKGEALGLRAFLHFELFRLFASHPKEADLQKKTIPYMTHMTRDINELQSLEANKVIAYIEADLNEAEKLLEISDPILEYTNAQLNTFSGTTRPVDDWQMCRQSRFNYYAVLATKARFYQWTGNRALAMAYAERVVRSEKFELGSNESLGVGGSLVLLEENIFNVVNPDHQDIAEGLFVEEGHRLKQLYSNIETAFEIARNPNDYRGKTSIFWMKSPDYEDTESERFYAYLKYCGASDKNIKSANTIPLIRLSEMYLILMELKPLTEAKEWFYDYRVARLLDATLDADFENDGSRMVRVEKEYRKEFFGEGQMFYFYKRLDYTTFSWPNVFVLPSLELYTMPKPEGQLNYELN